MKSLLISLVVISVVVLLAFTSSSISAFRIQQQQQQTKNDDVIASNSTTSYTYGGDLYKPYPSSTFQCLKQKGNWNFIITRAFHSYGAPDTSAPINLNNAKQAGIGFRDIYMFPCANTTKISADQQVFQTLQNVQWQFFGTMWFDIEYNPSTGCMWSTTDYKSNCDFLGDLIAAGKKYSVNLGLYSSHWEWNKVFGSYNCSVAADNKLPLWYASYNNNPSFANFIPFGGYTKAAIKQYNDKPLVTGCGDVIADADAYPL